MTDDRSRRTWPQPAGIDDTETTTTAVRTPMRLLDKLHLIIDVGLLLAVATLTFFVYQQQQYIEGRGEYRDRESARIAAESTERIRRATCDLLDTFPAGLPSLERARAKYGCGPGLPLSLLTPEEQARIAPQSAPAPVVPPTVGGGVDPDPPPVKAERPPAPEPVAPEPEPAPTDLTAPVLGLVCDLIPC